MGGWWYTLVVVPPPSIPPFCLLVGGKELTKLIPVVPQDLVHFHRLSATGLEGFMEEVEVGPRAGHY